MGKFVYGRSSRRRMNGVHELLIEVAERALDKSTEVDWGVGPYGGLRTAEVQNHLYKKGRSRADGYKKKSYHQTGLAIDLVPWINGKFTWANAAAFLEIRKLMFESWKDMAKENKVPPKTYLHWGGFWSAKDKNRDGIQQPNELGWDAPHFELRGYPQKINFQRIWDL